MATITTTTVRDATFDVLRERGLTTIFANPGSTEIQLLSGLPADLRFVLALHEASVVGLALATNEPALAILHTTAGLGNAVAALATARVNRAPLVVIVGQQDRRHLATQPFLAGRLEGLAGEYPVSAEQPVRAQDVPGAISRAYHAARTHRGPALVMPVGLAVYVIKYSLIVFLMIGVGYSQWSGGRAMAWSIAVTAVPNRA